MGRVRHGSMSMSVDIDVSDVLDELDDQDLIDELKARGKDANVVVANDLMAEVLLDVATAFHEAHSSGLPIYACPHTLCRDSWKALHPGEQKKSAA